jgi:ribonuclease VapC
LTKSIIFDSFAILKYYQDESGAAKVEKLLHSAQRGKIKVLINKINLGEVYYLTIRRIGLEPAKENLERLLNLPIEVIAPSSEITMERLLNLPIEVIAPSSEITMRAAEIKAQYAISYADCFAVATAELFSGSVLTGDPEFKKVEHLVAVDWI